MIGELARDAERDPAADPGSYAKAILNILEDAAGEKIWLEATQKAILNILDDAAAEKIRLVDTQRAALNILEDFDTEKNKVAQVNRDMAAEIAERKRAEEELLRAKAATDATNKELEAFSYSVSHDLRAPLRSIDGFSQALLEDYADRLDEPGRAHLARVRAATLRMGQLIDDLLQLSRMTRMEMAREPVDLSELAESVIEELQRTEPARRVEVAIEPELRVEGDPKLLRIVLVNLLSNAWKFTGRQAAARIELGFTGEGDERAYFVRDNGVGFDMAYAPKLFGAFQRLHAQGEFPGTGIGLATVQRIINRHGGRVWAEAAVNVGSTFYFALPANSNA
ncbi:MAG: sensor histidine kinase [Candidatus Limnocylindrales bacterium]